MKKIKALVLAIVVIVTLFATSCKKKIDPIPTPVDTAIKDASGNIYHEVTIGTQVWLKENLRTTKYNNGDAIPKEETTAWSTLTAGAYNAYGNLESNATIYGYLYNGYAAVDARGIAPKGYHVATKSDWETLVTAMGGLSFAGNRLKETGTIHWTGMNTATNTSGFTALGGGYRDITSTPIGLAELGFWWASTPITGFKMTSIDGTISMFTIDNAYGFSIRCVKDL